MNAYYNENDQFAVAWLRNLIARNLIARGEVDARSIVDVRASDLAGYTQHHFFAGIGVWSYALRCAGWEDDRPVWTGSCPCGPFSIIGRRHGFTDERHLWPVWAPLISECRPRIVLGEQVASKDGLAWLDLVHADMEAADYTVGAIDLCAAGVGAPHIRQRLYWVGLAGIARLERHAGNGDDATGWALPCRPAAAAMSSGALALADMERREEQRATRLHNHGTQGHNSARRGPVNGHWREADWLLCRDERWRCVEPGTFPLAHDAANRVGRLRGYGNALVAPVAQAFIEAVMEAMP
jgi:DNA (cytosine-5)-methyltransferase 1